MMLLSWLPLWGLRRRPPPAADRGSRSRGRRLNLRAPPKARRKFRQRQPGHCRGSAASETERVSPSDAVHIKGRSQKVASNGYPLSVASFVGATSPSGGGKGATSQRQSPVVQVPTPQAAASPTSKEQSFFILYCIAPCCGRSSSGSHPPPPSARPKPVFQFCPGGFFSALSPCAHNKKREFSGLENPLCCQVAGPQILPQIFRSKFGQTHETLYLVVNSLTYPQIVVS